VLWREFRHDGSQDLSAVSGELAEAIAEMRACRADGRAMRAAEAERGLKPNRTPLAYIWRFHSGQHMDGRQYSDATFFTPGTRDLDLAEHLDHLAARQGTWHEIRADLAEFRASWKTWRSSRHSTE